MDEDVPGAVGRAVDAVVGDRIAGAAAVDRTFARDVAERVARFTLLGGKRLRSRFLWWSFRTCGGGADTAGIRRALQMAAALELIQTCALVHDDLMDGSRLRRGRPALHVDFAAQYAETPLPASGVSGAFGVAAAVLAGDLALVWADDVVAGLDVPPGLHSRVGRAWQEMRTEMVAGQYLDLHAQATGSRSKARAIRAAYLKSALYTVERPIALGATLAGADDSTVRALRSSGRCAGIAFQFRDDLLGAFGDPRHTGKPSGEDIRAGKLTYLIAVARDRAQDAGDRPALALLDRALGDPELSEDELARVLAVLEATGARSAVENTIERLAVHGARRLEASAAASPARRRLRELLFSVADGRAARPAAAARCADRTASSPRATGTAGVGATGGTRR